MAGDKDNLLTELLDSERIGGFMSLAYGQLSMGLPDNPTWIWEQLRFNPWLAMAVYEDMEEKDDMLSTSLEARKENVLSKTRRVMPASNKRQDRKLAEFIDETLEGFFDFQSGTRIGIDAFLWEAMDSLGKGVAIGEIIYGEAPDRVYIKEVKFKPQHLFSFGEGLLAAYSTTTHPALQTGPLRLRPGIIAEGLTSEEPLPQRKFFVHTFRPRQGNRWGSPLDRKCYWLSWFKRAGVKQWLRLLEKGPGSTVTRYNDGAGTAEQDTALKAAQAINEESAVAVPKKFEIEVLEHVRTSMGSSYKEMVDDFCNNGIARLIRGQTLTSRGSEGGRGALSLGEVHERVEATKTETDSVSLMMAVNTQFVWPLTLIHQGPTVRPPIWTIEYAPGADLELITKYLERLWKMRVPLSRSYVYNTFPGIQPESDDDVLESPQKGDTNNPGIDDGEDGGGGFNEKKSLPGASSTKRKTQPGLRMERFRRLRPSTMQRSAR
jgi:phage gp29-like protein